MNNIEQYLKQKFNQPDAQSLSKYLQQNFKQLDFGSIAQVTLQSVFQVQTFISSFIKSNQHSQQNLSQDEKDDLYLYVATLLKYKLFTFPETVEFFIPRSFQSFMPQSLRQAFYNFKKSKKMSQLQVFLNFNFIDLQQLYQTDPESQKQRYEQFYSNWILYIQGNNQILRQINPEVYQLMSGEIQVQIPTAIQQLTEDNRRAGAQDKQHDNQAANVHFAAPWTPRRPISPFQPPKIDPIFAPALRGNPASGNAAPNIPDSALAGFPAFRHREFDSQHNSGAPANFAPKLHKNAIFDADGPDAVPIANEQFDVQFDRFARLQNGHFGAAAGPPLGKTRHPGRLGRWPEPAGRPGRYGRGQHVPDAVGALGAE